MRPNAASRADRVIFAPFVTPSQHLARLPQADLFLDTFPYGAHTTCSDALWMGLPVLTQTGRTSTITGRNPRKRLAMENESGIGLFRYEA